MVVTGVGMITPLGRNTGETFEHARQGRSGIDYLRAFDTRGLPVRIGGEVADQWIQQPPGVAARLERMASRAIQLMWTAAMEATEQAKLGRIRDRYRSPMRSPAWRPGSRNRLCRSSPPARKVP